MASGGGFKIWRVLEEEESSDARTRIIRRKEFIGEIFNPKQEIYLTWIELVEGFGEGYYLVEIPADLRGRYVLPETQFVRTPAYFEPSPFVRREGSRFLYCRMEQE
jgi:hypothetical protein